MAQIRVTYAKLSETADTIAAANTELKGVLDEIKGVIETLRGKWESEGADKFRDQFLKLNTNIEAYERELSKYCTFLNHTAEEYRTVDAKVVEETSVLDATSLFS